MKMIKAVIVMVVWSVEQAGGGLLKLSDWAAYAGNRRKHPYAGACRTAAAETALCRIFGMRLDKVLDQCPNLSELDVSTRLGPLCMSS